MSFTASCGTRMKGKDKLFYCGRRVLQAVGVASALAALLIAGCPPSKPIEVTVSTGQSGAPITRDQILAQAKREGEVNWYTSLPAEHAQAIAEKFSERFPFITCRVVRSGTFEIVRRVQAEINRGDVQADVIHVLDPGAFVALQQAGHLYKYVCSQAKYLPPNLRSQDYWNACRAVVTVIAVRQGSKLKIDSWRSLLGLPAGVRIGIKDAETSGSAYATYYLLREKYGYSFWEEIAGRGPRIYRSEEEMLRALTSGEVDLLAGVMANTAAKAEGVRIIWPKDGVPMVVAPIAILAMAPHPNAAKLMVDFLLSHTGQELIRDVTGAYPARPDVGPPKGLQALSELPLLRPSAPWDLYTAIRDYLQPEYNEIFRPSSE